jgi:hypothetical protein
VSLFLAGGASQPNQSTASSLKGASNKTNSVPRNNPLIRNPADSKQCTETSDSSSLQSSSDPSTSEGLMTKADENDVPQASTTKKVTFNSWWKNIMNTKICYMFTFFESC